MGVVAGPAGGYFDPPRSLSVQIGEPATLTVSASGGQLLYQWRRDGVNLQDDGRIVGSRAAILSINYAAPSDAGNYDVQVSNGCQTRVSEAAELLIEPACSADFNHDGSVNSQDFFDFVAAFFAGCP